MEEYEREWYEDCEWWTAKDVEENGFGLFNDKNQNFLPRLKKLIYQVNSL
jgi:hypothetical protein